MEKRWIVKPKAPQEFKDQFSQYSPIILNLLYDRDIRTQEDIEQFLNPQYEQHVHDPFLFDQMEVAVKRVFDAIAAQERIVIHEGILLLRHFF
mgnify:CR=1 FL=1